MRPPAQKELGSSKAQKPEKHQRPGLQTMLGDEKPRRHTDYEACAGLKAQFLKARLHQFAVADLATILGLVPCHRCTLSHCRLVDVAGATGLKGRFLAG